MVFLSQKWRYGATTFKCGSATQQVFLMPGSNFYSAGYFTFSFSGCTTSQTIIILVSGTSVTVSYRK